MRTTAGLLHGIVAAFLVFFALEVCAEDSPRTFSHPDRIRYDSHCLIIDGKDMVIYSGAFHYFRCPKELWRDRFQKIKDAGFNAVETYVAWNWHEKEMPKDLNDFSKVNLKELDEWLKMAEDFGFYIIVRPGPYICAEWDTGGFPQWLLTKKPEGFTGEWLRSDDPAFLAWSKHWYQAVCPVIAKHQITRKSKGKPGVILFQIENEYDYARFPDSVKINHLRALAAAAQAGGIDVPLTTCWTRQVRGSEDPLLRQVFDSCNFYPRWNTDGELNSNIPRLRAQQPDAPLMTTELQGGWFSQVGGKLSEDQDGITAAQINHLTLLALEHGETILNYYMLFGGSNFADSGARSITTTYDYNAPIREWGGVGDRYQRVWAIGHMLREHGARLARAESVDCNIALTNQTSQGKSDVTVTMRRAPDGSRYFFVRTSQHTEPREGTAHVTPKTSGENQEIVFHYQLEPFGAAILYLPPGINDAAQGEWLPKPAPAIERPATLPAKIEITTARQQSDPGPERWMKMETGQRLAQLGVYDSGLIFYKAAISDSTITNLQVSYPSGDAVLAAMDGKPVSILNKNAARSSFEVPASPGTVTLLYENLGHANGGSAMENPCGISSVQLTAAPSEERAIAGWRMHEVDNTRNRPEVRVDFPDENWEPVAVDQIEANNLRSGHNAVYRAALVMTAEDLAAGNWALTFGRIDDTGWIYVNGQKVGDAADWSQEQSFEVTPQLHPGTNVIAVIVHNDDGDGGIGKPALAHELEKRNVPLEAFGRPAGVEGRWSKPSFDDRHWQAVNIGESAQPINNMLEWYRMDFQMPRPKRHEWIPWRLHIDAAGNGFLYLNGHALGRYWEAGPQHDFFLPECWLDFGGNNVATLSLRPLGKGTAIEAASVEPYGEFAEKR